MCSHCCFIVVDKFLELQLIGEVQFGEAEKPFIDVDRVLVADGGSFQEIICILLSLGLGNIFLDILIESHCLMQVNGLLIIEVNVIENLFQLCFLFLAQLVEGLLLRNQCAA